ncbi:hypothetical protein [Filomicrobium sp.]|uniref:hypothetical protein n=1 Tax=Filomicrobium sp. TaxID=2024831 RepID=UPI00258A8EC8|nr:hypothetical protein [Filomicrobium sp.]MCV0371116.1 hypothetical protein [Filomicrobium sp.]
MSDRDNSDDAELCMNGQHAFWAGKPFDPEHPTLWRHGWLSAAAMARTTLDEHRAVLEAIPQIRDALCEANAAVRALLPAKATPRQRQLASSAAHLIDETLPRLECPAAGAPLPGPAPISHSRPGRARAKRRT